MVLIFFKSITALTAETTISFVTAREIFKKIWKFVLVIFFLVIYNILEWKKVRVSACSLLREMPHIYEYRL